VTAAGSTTHQSTLSFISLVDYYYSVYKLRLHVSLEPRPHTTRLGTERETNLLRCTLRPCSPPFNTNRTKRTRINRRDDMEHLHLSPPEQEVPRLRSLSDHNDDGNLLINGTVVILIIVCIVFFVVWYVLLLQLRSSSRKRYSLWIDGLTDK